MRLKTFNANVPSFNIGLNEFVWDMHYDAVEFLKLQPIAAPGKYKAKLSVDGVDQISEFELSMQIVMKQMKAKILNRKVHRWAAVLTAVPVIIVIVTGIILQVKKEFDWIQPPTQRGTSTEPVLSFEQILNVVSEVPDIGLTSWDDINRLDVRPKKGIIKVRGNNDWEVQIDSKTGDVLQVAVRRSDFIESIHDGSFFHESFKLWVFLPSALILTAMWGTGIYLFLLPYMLRRHRRKTKWNATA